MKRADRSLRRLKALLRTKGITHADLAKHLGLKTLAIQRALSGGSMTLDRVLQICEFAQIDPVEILKPDASDLPYHKLSRAEDDYFEANGDQYLFFLELAARESLSEATARFKISQAQAYRLVKQLERAGFVELMPQDRLRFPKGTALKPHPRGSLLAKFRGLSSVDYMSADFNSSKAFFEFVQVSLGKVETETLQTELKKIVETILLARPATDEGKKSARQFGLLIALRPWQFDAAEIYHRVKK